MGVTIDLRKPTTTSKISLAKMGVTIDFLKAPVAVRAVGAVAAVEIDGRFQCVERARRDQGGMGDGGDSGPAWVWRNEYRTAVNELNIIGLMSKL